MVISTSVDIYFDTFEPWINGFGIDWVLILNQKFFLIVQKKKIKHDEYFQLKKMVCLLVQNEEKMLAWICEHQWDHDCKHQMLKSAENV